MNKTITDGLVLQPTPFSAGLDVWSSGDGTAGSPTYQNASNAAFVPADQDFGGALELLKTQSTQKLRYMLRTPIEPGCYLRIRARVKAVSGNLPSVRIAGWAGRGNDVGVGGITEVGPSTALTAYGQVVEISAIVGTGARGGVDMVWGGTPTYGYFGLDLTGPSGGVVRIDDIDIEDITGAYLSDLIPVVDVLDFGAKGDGVTDDSAAFEAADAASEGREIIVPAGTYRLAQDVTIDTRIRFEGTVTQPRNRKFVLRKNFDLATYIDAFGDEVEAFKKAFQALLTNADHDSLDMCGRRIETYGPIDMADAGEQSVFEIRRTILNGQFNVKTSANWNTRTVTAQAGYDPSANQTRLTGVTNVANIEVGSHVIGNGVGREVYVRSKNVGAGTIELSQPLWGAGPQQSYTFKRYRYVLDFSGFTKLSKFTLDNVELYMDGKASGILLAPEGETFHVRDCSFGKPMDRGITSHGRGCQDLQIDRCHFLSDEQGTLATQRTSVGFNINANDGKIRDNRFQRLGTTMVLDGAGHLIVGNHWFQGDNGTNTPRVAGVVFTQTNPKSIITGNYLDNSFVEMTNQHEAFPALGEQFSFGGLTLTGNIFTVNDSADWFSWIVVKPFGPGHFIHGLSVTGNTFRSINGQVDRVETVDDSIAPLDASRHRMIEFTANSFHNIRQETINPVTLEFNQSTAAQTWTLAPGAWMPFDGWTRTIAALQSTGAITDGGGNAVFDMPNTSGLDGADNDRVKVRWSRPVKGKVQLTVRCDKPF
ncbi:right-handed parallel beta-helix repeat-containing protein [Maribius pontilimi]|uniref:Right-handed parallel beta-helix repeat-containing protein n=1 Tax=Palleronia pontilimi TaxID=1964209 RepID=A0A934IFX1_9RHOB|nr:glycosyl hydrolase family 28-related protein [Palleronia pontilimi]MBJ3762148.1 right-handed parallel beta-helix repeat-containing protein [Palleronia pontilimi]